jgi:hypothetical protein
VILRIVRALLSVICVLPALALAQCAGCSEECSGDARGADGCPCSSDQDCTTRLGAVLLCTDGTCVVGDPPDAPGAFGACTDDADCGAGLACGVDEICVAAPRCQRIEVALQTRAADGSSEAVDASLAGCTHAWTLRGSSITADVDLDGVMQIGNVSGAACTAGRWFAGQRVGEIVCGGESFAIGPPAVVGRACVGDCGAQCTLLGVAVGVCP